MIEYKFYLNKFLIAKLKETLNQCFFCVQFQKIYSKSLLLHSFFDIIYYDRKA